MRHRETSIQRRAEGFRLLHDGLSAFQHIRKQQAPGGMRDFHLAAALEHGDALYWLPSSAMSWRSSARVSVMSPWYVSEARITEITVMSAMAAV
jgi:hypothetical protein